MFGFYFILPFLQSKFFLPQNISPFSSLFTSLFSSLFTSLFTSLFSIEVSVAKIGVFSPLDRKKTEMDARGSPQLQAVSVLEHNEGVRGRRSEACAAADPASATPRHRLPPRLGRSARPVLTPGWLLAAAPTCFSGGGEEGAGGQLKSRATWLSYCV